MQSIKEDRMQALPWDERDNPSFVLDEPDTPLLFDDMELEEEPEPSSGFEGQDDAQEKEHRSSFRLKSGIKRQGAKDRAMLEEQWENAQNKLFLDEAFFSMVLDIMVKFQFEPRNCILIAAQRPDAVHLASESSWKGLGTQVRSEELKKPVWVFVREKSMHPDKVYDVAQTETPDISTVPETIFNTRAVVKIAMSFLDEQRIIYSSTGNGIWYSVKEQAFLAQSKEMRSFWDLMFEAIKALAQRDLIQVENRELTGSTRYIAEAASYIVCGYFHMLGKGKRVRLSEEIRSDQIDQVVEDLACARRIALHYIARIRDRLRARKWRDSP